MIQGKVVFGEGPQAGISLAVLGVEGRTEWVDAAIDTGFDRDLTLPPDLIQRLGLYPRGQTQVFLAGDREADIDSFYGMVELDGERLPVDVYQVEGQPLIGMRLLIGFRLTVEVTAGGAVTVTVERLP